MMKIFRDLNNKFILTYWYLNKGEDFYTCTLGHLPLEKDGNVEDLGCTFHTMGKLSFQETGTDDIQYPEPGSIFNRRPQKSIKITALDDNIRFCYALDMNSLYTVNMENPDVVVNNSKRKVVGEHIKVQSGEVVEVTAEERIIYIFNPFFNSPPNTLIYKTPEEENYNNLSIGKCIKIEKGKSVFIQSVVSSYIPKFYCIEK